MIRVTIDGRPIEVPAGTTVLQAAERLGIRIPTLCHYKNLSEEGSCRLCVVEIASARGTRIDTACTSVCADGDEIQTMSEAVVASRRQTLDLLLSEHRVHCFSCEGNGDCRLQELCMEYGLEETSYHREGELLPEIDESNKFFRYDASLCVRCHRCVRTCEEVVGRGAIDIIHRGLRSRIGAGVNSVWTDSGCESCGNCVQACPTGALTARRRKDFRAFQIERKVRTTCPHCATGCQLELCVKGGKIVEARAADGPSNGGRLCVKGRFASFDFLHAGDRLTHPLIRDRATGLFRQAGWDEALDLVASRFMELKEKYGPDALAGFACSRSPNEDVYLVQKMVRACFGTNNVDNCARVCHSASVTGLSMTLGSGAMTNPIRDITQEPDLVFLIGSNPEEAHPVVGMQLRRAVQRGCRLIVADPRDIDLAKSADVHLKLCPGTDVALINGMMHVILEEGLEDRAFIAERTEDFELIREIVKDYTPQRAAEICHLRPEDVVRAAELYARADKAPIIYCLGVTEHSTGTEGVMSMSNLALLVGKLGRPGCGVNPLRGQNNVQGACDMGAMPTDFPGYQKVAAEGVVEKFEKAWGVPLPRGKGVMATDVFPAAIHGDVRGLYIYGENPVITDADTHHIVKALQSLDFLVVQELFLTETARYADVVLPGAAYAEKEGTFTNTERRVQRVRKAVEPPEGARLDTDILIDLMNRMGYPQPPLTAAEIMDEIASLTPSYGGVSHARLDSAELGGRGLQWPCPTAEHPGTEILHVDRFSRGKARFYPAQYIPAAEQPDEEYPLILMTGRILYHYNARAMTGRTAGLMEIEGSSFIEMNIEDADRLGILNGDAVRVSSRRGEIRSTARVGRKTSPGETWMPFHFPDGGANVLTNAALDPLCRIPEYKVCAVKVEKI